jgi:hypothetical protein
METTTDTNKDTGTEKVMEKARAEGMVAVKTGMTSP